MTAKDPDAVPTEPKSADAGPRTEPSKPVPVQAATPFKRMPYVPKRKRGWEAISVPLPLQFAIAVIIGVLVATAIAAAYVRWSSKAAVEANARATAMEIERIALENQQRAEAEQRAAAERLRVAAEEERARIARLREEQRLGGRGSPQRDERHRTHGAGLRSQLSPASQLRRRRDAGAAPTATSATSVPSRPSTCATWPARRPRRSLERPPLARRRFASPVHTTCGDVRCLGRGEESSHRHPAERPEEKYDGTHDDPHRHGDKVLAVRHMLTARGLDARDFDIEEDTRSGISQLLGLAGGIITLRRRSTGEIRVYAAGPGSAWYATIAMDLGPRLLQEPRPDQRLPAAQRRRPLGAVGLRRRGRSSALEQVRTRPSSPTARA